MRSIWLRLRGFVIGVWRRPYMMGFILLMTVIIVGVFVILDSQKRNRQAIEKGCILLNNAIVQSSQSGANPASKILVQEILRNAEAHGRFYVTAGYEKAIASQGATFIALIPCSKVAHDPESITAIKLPPPPPRSPVRVPPDKK